MAGKKDPALELGEKMQRLLESQRGAGGAAYPTTLRQLAELADPTGSLSLIQKAIGKKTFSRRMLIARKKDADSPLAFVEDAELLAGSQALLEFILRTLRTASNQAFSASTLKAKVTSKLQKPFQAALYRQLEENALPATIGWLSINRSKKLFLLSDVHTRAPVAQVKAVPLQEARSASPAVPPLDFALAFERAFDQLDRHAGSHNFVSLVELRGAVPVNRHVFDVELHKLRLCGRYGLSAAEGRHGLTAVEQEAGIMEDGTLLLYVSRKPPLSQ